MRWLLVFVVACSFSDPDLSKSQFLCDATGACPDGQSCRGGLCVVATHDGVACTVSCAAGEQCCDDGTNPPRCLPASETCFGVTAFCDGREDCAPGSVCCSVGPQQRCDESCLRAACQEPADCPGDSPNCCPDPDDPQPWKFCSLDPC